MGINIPKSSTVNENTFAVIIAIENYDEVSDVPFAKNDGEIFKEYCVQTLGLPDNQVRMFPNATLNNIKSAITWMKNVAKSHTDANIIFYYAGHGIPDESSKSAYLLPKDGSGSDATTGYKLDDLYTTLGALPAKSVIVFLDACFSGAKRNQSGDMIVAARAVAIAAKEGEPTGNTVVFSAAQGDETAYPYREKGHGIFTYFILKKLQETHGEATLGELSDYVTKEVRSKSVLNNPKQQTPTVTPSATMEENWKNLKLK